MTELLFTGEQLGRLALQFLLAGAGTLSFAILFACPRRTLPYCGLVGAVGWFVYETAILFGLEAFAASLLAVIPLTLLARIFAVALKTPVTIFLLTGLFVVIGGIKNAGVIDIIGNAISKVGGSSGSVFIVYTVIVWMSVILSAFIDNIPYTATMLTVIPVIAVNLGIDPKIMYYGLLCGATLGGNLTPIGASANIAGIGILRKEGHEVKATTFMKYGVPFTLAAVITGYLLIWLIWKP